MHQKEPGNCFIIVQITVVESQSITFVIPSNMTDALVQSLYPSCQAILGMAFLHRRNKVVLDPGVEVEFQGRKLEAECEKSETMQNIKQSLYVISYK